MKVSKSLLRALWCAAVFTVVILSMVPGDSSAKSSVDLLGINDKLEHLLAYSVLAFLPAIHERRDCVVFAALGAVALGIGLEFAQLYSPGRSFEVGDMVANVIGVCSGVILGILVRSRLCTYIRPAVNVRPGNPERSPAQRVENAKA